MELGSFLEQAAALTGRALAAAKNACDRALILTMADLQLAKTDNNEFEKMFPQGILRMKISAALEAHDAAEVAADEREPNETLRKQERSDAQAHTLPAGLNFHFFLSQ